MKSRSLLKASLDLIFSMRPLLLIPVWGFVAFGYWHATGNKIEIYSKLLQKEKIYVFLLMFTFSLSVGAVYIFNQLADIEVDKKNGGLPLIASGFVPTNRAILFAIFLSVLSIIVPFFLSLYSISILSALSILTGILYSYKPSFFSGKPFLDFLTNAIGYGFIAFSAGWNLGGKSIVSSELLFTALPYFFLMCSGSINSTLPDYSGDKTEAKNTTAVYLGIKKAHLLSTFFLCIALGISIYQANPLSITISAICLPIYMLFIFYQTDLLMESTYKVGGVFCMVGAILVFPIILPVSLVVFLFTWLYFRLRHGVFYPSLVVVRNDS